MMTTNGMTEKPGDSESNELATAINGNEERPLESSDVEKKQQSLWIIYFTMFIAMLGISIGISSTWPYLQKIDQHVSPTFLGWTYFSFNVAAILGDISLGTWLRYRPNREPMIGVFCISILSPILFVFAQGIGGRMGLIAVLISRAFLGYTRGNMTVTRSIISDYTSVLQRSVAMARLSIAMTIGFASGSGLQALIALMGDRSVFISPLKLHINLYTIPALFLILCGVITAGLIFHFVKPTEGVSDSKRTVSKTADRSNKRNPCVLVTLLIMFSLVNFSLSLMESLTVPLLQHQYALSKPKAVTYGGLVFTAQGLTGCFVQVFAMRFLFSRFSDRFLIAIAYGCIAASFIFYIPMGGIKLMLQGGFGNATINNTMQDSTLGCPREFEWCHDTPQLYFPQLIIAALLFCIGYSTCIGLLVSLFTKVVSAGNQSTSVSLISACGSIGRLTAPIIGTYSYVNIGPQYTFTWASLLISVTFIAFLCQYQRMTPQKTEKLLDLSHSNHASNVAAEKYPYFVTPV